MNRRDAVLGLAAIWGAGVSFGLAAQQPARIWRIGVLSATPRPASLNASNYGAFLQGMRELGYEEGKNIEVDWRFADGMLENLASLAADLARLKLDVIVATSGTAVRAAQKATASIPIVMTTTGDPVGNGFIKSFAIPGGNITGSALFAVDLMAKHLEMLLSVVPKLTRVAVLGNPAGPNYVKSLESVRTEAQKRRIAILPVEARSAAEIEPAFARMKREKAGAVIVVLNPVFFASARLIGQLVVKYRLPSVAGIPDYVTAGGLISYGSSFTENYRRAASYTDRILKGALPGDLPVEQPTKLDLFINGKTARMLGLKIPQSLLISADKVIE